MADRYSKMGASDFQMTYGYSIRHIANKAATIIIEFSASTNSNNATKEFCLKNILKAATIAIEEYGALPLSITSFDVIRNVIDTTRFSISMLLEFKEEQIIGVYETKLKQIGVIL